MKILAAIVAIFGTLLSCARATGTGPYSRAVVATVNPMATEAGLDAVRQGGNAIDAAIACALTLGVVDGHNSGLGGGCFLLIRLADGRVVAIDGRETAPARATATMFVRDGTAVSALSLHGPLAVGTPGELAALALASTNFGKLPLSVLFERAANLADTGFPISRASAGAIAGAKREIDALPVIPLPPPATGPAVAMAFTLWPGNTRESLFGEFARIFLGPNETPPAAGSILRQPDLARSYRMFARLGPDAFYRGEFTHQVDDWMRRHHGILGKSDFENYQAQWRTPVRTTYRGFEILGFPPPSSGGVHVGQILNILERFDLASMGDRSADFVHTVAEAMKLAFADRAFWLGDPSYAKVPQGLVDERYAVELARRINPTRATVVESHGNPPGMPTNIFAATTVPSGSTARHTTHFTTADSEGNWVACTATVNTTFGSKVIVPGTGIVLNNQMDDFSAQPGMPNAFGLIGAEANAVAPGKRPLSSMSPTFVLKDGRPVFSVGAAGGPTIISQAVLAIIRFVDFGCDPKTALERPRFHHQWKPDELVIERAFGEDVARTVEQRGHRVQIVNSLGAAQALAITPGGLVGAHDPRVEGLADGF